METHRQESAEVRTVASVMSNFTGRLVLDKMEKDKQVAQEQGPRHADKIINAMSFLFVHPSVGGGEVIQS